MFPKFCRIQSQILTLLIQIEVFKTPGTSGAYSTLFQSNFLILGDLDQQKLN